MSLSITPLSPPDTRSKNAIDRMEHPAVPIVKGVICVAPLEVNEPEAAINSLENELSEEEEEEDSTSGIVESSTATVKRDNRQVSRRRPFAFVKSLATVMQLSSRNKRKVGSSRSCP